ncbi:MAG: M48 family metalloprotease [Pseudomonadota bacterium]
MKLRLPFLAAAMSVCLTSCGLTQPEPVRDEERRAGAKQHPILLAELGGAYRGDEAGYVTALGARLAAKAGLADRCTFTLVNSDVVNAFAVPGCYIYVTRGLLAIVNSEAELASVLAHEVGHIAADHGERQEKRALWRSLGVAAIATITGSDALTRLAGQAAGLFTLRYSRQHEYEADALSVRYLRDAGYDPYAAVGMLGALGRNEAYQKSVRGVDDARSIPEWARTHPLTERRLERAAEGAGALGVQRDELPENVLGYLRSVDGLLYGDDPEQGFIVGRQFAHPVMRIGFEAPPGFTLSNSPQQILIEGPDGLRGSFSGGPVPSGGLPAYAGVALERTLGSAPVTIVSTRQGATNGGRALYLAGLIATSRGEVPISMAVYEAPDGGAYHFLVVSRPDSTVLAAVPQLFSSFHFLTQDELTGLRPRRIKVVLARPGQTVSDLAAVSAGAATPEMLLMLNGLSGRGALGSAQPVKSVVWSR